jgi:hypothetical protein
VSAVDQRLYYLMLSPQLGQEFAHNGGFSKPSEDVQEAETVDVISRWTVLTLAGLLEDVIETADWFCQLEVLSDVDQEQLKKTLVSHGVGLLNRLLDSGKISIVLELEDEEEEDEDE